MARRFRFKKNYKKKYFKRKYKQNVRSLMSKPDNRKIEMQVGVYVYWDPVAQAGNYTLSSSTSNQSVFNLQNVTNGFTQTAEFQRIAPCYQACKLNGFTVQFNRSLNISDSAGNWLELPMLTMSCLPYFSSVSAGDSAYASDMRCTWQVLNTMSRPDTFYYKMPKCLTSSASYTYGSGVWNSVTNYISSNNYAVWIVIDTNATLVRNSNTGTVPFFQLLGTLDFIFYMSFANRTLVTA